MTFDDSTVQLVRDALIMALKTAAPILAAGMIIGLVVSLVQSVTSIQDQTISFVPKIVGMIVVAVLVVPWIVQRMVEYSAGLFRLW
ncbi:MAG: flagellar biosynthetic protein FliQ [Phycisphaeraceae bacterium]|nr:MAG: flagellar biosynthetic protein FliQ [Phycisphaeraceae bacterium]